MGKVGRSVGRFLSCFLLLLFLVCFILVFSISHNLNKDNLTKVAGEVIKAEVKSQIAQAIQLSPDELIASAIGEEGEVDYVEAYNKLVVLCEIEDSISFENIEYEMSCGELKGLKPEDFRTFFLNEYNNKIQSEINKKFQELDSEMIYQFLLSQCEDKQTLYLENFDYNLDCERLRAAGSQGLELILEEEIANKINLEIDRRLQEAGLFGKLFKFIEVFVWTFGALCVIMVIILFMLSPEKYHFFIDLGIVSLIAGLPIFIIGSFESQDNQVSFLIDSVVKDILINMIVLMCLGLALLVFGIIYRRVWESNKKDVDKKSN